LLQQLASLMIGFTPRLRRVMTYWAATAFIYSLSALIVVREAGMAHQERVEAALVAGFGFGGVTLFYFLLRFSNSLGIPHWKLALAQAYYAVLYNMSLYAALGDLRGAILIGLPVVIVFCAFALRPAQTICLSVFAFAALVATSAALVHWRPLGHPPGVEVVHVFLASFGVASVALINSELSKLRARLIDAVATIRLLATTDELTRLANRRHMQELLTVEHERRSRKPGPACVALIDIDFFKRINDRYGHAAGDSVLQGFAHAASATGRAGDTLGRWGGEEFLLLMPDSTLDEAQAALARIRAAVAALRFDSIDPALRLSFSAGVAAAAVLDARFDDAIGRADAAMYAAKTAGRDRVLAAPGGEHFSAHSMLKI
jgi:diguanylate cyclase (GGDEF)-like protein